MQPQISPSSPVAVSLQVVEAVRQALQRGALQPGEYLPAAGGWAETLVISRAAIVRAYEQLEREGLISGDRRVLTGRTAAFDIRSSAAPGTLASEWMRLRTDAASAERAQQRLLPAIPRSMPGVICAAAYRPALGVGGDYYDFLPLSSCMLGVAIADACGKGAGAALLMASLRAFLRAQAAEGALVLPDAIGRLNDLVFESSAADRYSTFFYAQYDGSTRSLAYVNAGHLPPMVITPHSTTQRLGAGGPALGLMSGAAYDSGVIQLRPGDTLVAFTDGISEAANANGDFWDESGLATVLNRNLGADPDAIVERLIQGARDFAGADNQSDDMTVIAVRFD